MNYPQMGRTNIFLKKQVENIYLSGCRVEELDAYNLQPAFIKDKVKDVSVHTEHIVLQK